MGVNISLPIALSGPIWKRKRKPQINRIGANDQDPQPMTRIKGDAIAAPMLPSKFLTGKSEADRGPGSVGEYVKIISEKRLIAKAVFGIFPANSNDRDEIEIYNSDSRSEIVNKFICLRQQSKKAANKPNYSISDYILDKSQDQVDYVGCFAVSAGFGADNFSKEYENIDDDYNSIMIKAIADRFAEAAAEYLHERVRKEFWGYANNEDLSNVELIDEKYKGIRPAPGYPACPDHLEKNVIWSLLDVEKNTGIKLTESLAMFPASSVSGYYFSNPDSRYFGLGKIDNDQLEDYAKRRNISIDKAKKWLNPIL